MVRADAWYKQDDGCPVSLRNVLCASVHVLLRAVLCFLLLSEVAGAWDYPEHVQTTHRAVIEACKATATNSADFALSAEKTGAGKSFRQRLCEDPQLQWCFAHSAALAGDHFQRPEDLAASLNSHDKSLLGTGFDCRNIMGLLTGTNDSAIEAETDKVQCGHTLTGHGATPPTPQESPVLCLLYPKSISNWLQYGSLAATNADHFMPMSKVTWSLLMVDLQSEKTSENPLMQWATAAFAMHFLEDSFAAGHVGLNRSRFQHDYDNAYHDDFNQNGRFMKNDHRSWYSYGDHRLWGSPIFYLPTCQFVRPEKSESDLIKELHEVFSDYQFSDAVDRDLSAGTDCSPNMEETRVLSLPNRHDGPLRWCFYMDDCEKQTIVLSPRFGETSAPDGCSRKSVGDRQIIIWQCDTETRAEMDVAAADGMMAIFLYTEGSIEEGNETKMRTQEEFPTKYRSLIPNNKRRATTINKNPIDLSFGDWTEASEFSAPPTTEWGFAVETESASRALGSRSALAWSIRLSDFIDSATRLLHGSRASSATQDTDDSGGKWALQNRYEVIDDRGYVLNSFEIDGYYDALRIAHRVFGLSPKLEIGIANVWEGGGRRNYYGGVGGSIDVHVGKQLFYLEFDRQWHKNGTIGDVPLWRATLGVRVMSINLSGS